MSLRSVSLLLLAPLAALAQIEAPAIDLGAAYRFLNHATFGATLSGSEHLQQIGYDQWISEQFALAPSTYPDYLFDKPIEWSQDYFYQNAMTQPDQLRQRVAFALHKIFVVSAVDVNSSPAMVGYLRLLNQNAFENIWVILAQVSLHPAMGEYLNMVNNDKSNAATGSSPNENYGREFLQLFTVGLNLLNRDGSAKLDAAGNPMPTYSEADVRSYARAFTGWTYANANGTVRTRGHNSPYYGDLMIGVESNHDKEAKTLLNGIEAAAGQTAYADLQSVINSVYTHPNIAPFLSKQLIQQLVNSNPSPAYVDRVAQAFEDDGAGVRGNMKSVVYAILTDAEAMNPPVGSSGHLKEPALVVTSLMRSIGAVVADHPVLSDASAEMGQKLFFPSSVFSYFSPSYRVPGLGLVGPEFQILTGETSLSRVNYAARVIYGSFGQEVKLDTQRFMDAANGSDTAGLVNMVNVNLFGGTMPQDMIDSISRAVDAQRGASAKVKTALYLASSSPLFQVIQ